MRLGIVGTGLIVQEFLPEITAIEGIECVALAATPRSEEKMRELMTQYQIPEGYTDYEQFLAADIDTVYLAVPNHLHYEYALEALQNNKNVIVEKPITGDSDDTRKLVKLAHLKNLFLFEAITTQYLPNYKRLAELLPRIGRVKMIQCNYSQYSRRYDRFLQGEVEPAFDPAKRGGALYDLNLYNIHFVVGLFGEPESVAYHANVELPGGIPVSEESSEADRQRMIDVSGVVVLDYPDYEAVCIAAKDCAAPGMTRIQGTLGYLMQDTPANRCGEVTLVLNDGTTQTYSENGEVHRCVAEFREFNRMITHGELKECHQKLEISRIVSKVMSSCAII